MSESGGRSAGRVVAAVILAIIAILFVIAGVLYASETAGSLPGVLNSGSSMRGTGGHHTVREIGSFVVAAIFFAAAWFSLAYRGGDNTPARGREESPAGQR